MKNIFIAVLMIFSFNSKAQELETIYLNKDVTTHILSKVNISKIDLSTDYVAGQITNKKIIAIKPKSANNIELGILTIIGEDYFLQYKMIYTNDLNYATTQLKIDDTEDHYFLNPAYEMTNVDMFRYCKKIEDLEPTYHNVAAKDNKAIISLNNIIVKNHYIFIDYSIENKTNLIYDINDVKYTIDDKKVVKNTNVQRLIVEPEYQFNKSKTFKKKYRNIVCFDKMTFPDNKEFIIELSEEQISGRTVQLSISYMDILNADTL
jgi:conjugative transposon TraN protein